MEDLFQQHSDLVKYVRFSQLSKSATPREGSLIYRRLGWAAHGPLVSAMRLPVHFPEPFTTCFWIPFQQHGLGREGGMPY